MGTWGRGLYQNDLALDVKDLYLSLKRSGESCKEITNNILTFFSSECEDKESQDLIILVLADLQCKYGDLDSKIKRKAKKIIKKGDKSDFLQCEEYLKKTRRKCLETLGEKINTYKKKENSISQPKVHKPIWFVGDVYAYLIDNPTFKNSNLYNKYVIIIVHNQFSYDTGEIVPVVWLKFTRDNVIPTTLEEINELDFIQIYFRYKDEKQHYMIQNSKPKEDEILPIYSLGIIKHSKRTIPKNIIYLGNYQNINPPKNEFIPEDICWVPITLWKRFEDVITVRYRLYNEKQGFDNHES